MKNIIKELNYRELLYNSTNNLINFFKSKNNKFYFGIDPTYKSLHLGHLLGLSIINRFFNLGYNKYIILFGEATTLIKNKYNINKVKKNIKYLKKQIIYLSNNKNIKFINNILWYKKMLFLPFAKKILFINSINNFLKNKKINNMIVNNVSIKFTDFIYHILQGYDYLLLYKKFNCVLQIGGSDQWYNILTGIKLIKKNNKKESYGFTFPLLLNDKGIKFSKSNKNINNIWVSKKKTSVYDIYRYFINLSDITSIKYFKYFSTININNVKKIIIKHNNNKKKKIIQKYLINFFIKWIYNHDIYREIKKVMNILYKNKLTIIRNNIKLIKKYIKNINIKIKKTNYITIYEIININKDIFKSYKEYRNYIKNNGTIYINCKIIVNSIIYLNNLLYNKFLIIKKGKKDFYLLIIKFINNE
ncbi:MAG: tyrosine--tRNA ligase [Candidatus Shikimatogenerans bostrichidophilus]|nr:MAG: tyrosine--tRNA ligase [Candidatus Shikimatogenerans bostrichidophilus]